MNRVAYFGRLRAIACIAVVVLHTFYGANSLASTSLQHTLAMSVRNMMLWAVPCFVMVSGALLLDKARTITIKKIMSKYVLRMAIPLVIFSLIFALFDAVLVQKELSASFITTGIKNALFGGGWAHMWYLYLMIAIYLLLPFYRMIARSADKNELIYLLAVYLVFLVLIPLSDSFTENKLAFYICVYSVYPLYLFAGYAIHNEKLIIPIWLSWTLTIGGAALIIGLTVYSYNADIPNVSSLLSSYAFPGTVAFSAGVFSLAKRTESVKSGIFDKILFEIDRCSFGIYLVHMAVLKLFLVVLGWNPFGHGGMLVMSLAVFAASYIIVFLLKLIPGVKKLL